MNLILNRAVAAALLAAAISGCADMEPRDVPGMPGVTVRAVRDPEPPAVEASEYTNRLGHLVTIYYADGRMQAVAAGDTVPLIAGVRYTVQVNNPRKPWRKNA